MKKRRPPFGYKPEDLEKRKQWMKHFTDIDISNIVCEKTDNLTGIIENHIGYMTIPMAIAGPLSVHGTYIDEKDLIVPVCTVEGTLVLSMNRGMQACGFSDGVMTQHYRQEISRAPAFFPQSFRELELISQYIITNFDRLKEIAESTTRYGKLLRIDQHKMQRILVIDCVFNTGNAAGQNMVTIATQQICEHLRHVFNGMHYVLESGFNSDKKASSRNLIEGRGHGVMAEAYVTKRAMNLILGIRNISLLRDFEEAALISDHLAGTIGRQLHVSNALTAIYLATGQDTACVAENSIGFSTLHNVTEDGFGLRVTLPSITVGTVGGGTRLPMQYRNLQLLDCTEGEYSSRRLSEIIAASALCLELSLMSAIITETFAGAHSKYGRS